MLLEQIVKPSILLNENICKRNIQQMLERAKAYSAELRPHFKTHQSKEIAQFFKTAGVGKITVSSLSMAAYFAEDWNDITVAFPVNLREINTIKNLAQKVKLNLLVESAEELQRLGETLPTQKIYFYIKVDVGTKRAGVDVKDHVTIGQILEIEKQFDQLQFEGFLAHTGHSYACRSVEEINQLQTVVRKNLLQLKSAFVEAYPKLILSLGDTPCCSKATDWQGIDEWRPGNFVFYDLMQWQISSCNLEDIAVAVACPVVAKHASRNELLIYGGAVHFAKDYILLNDQKNYGLIAPVSEKGWAIPRQGNVLQSISQEHGVAKVEDDFFQKIRVGDLIAVLPIHSCMTANSLAAYYGLSGTHYQHFNG